jgi:ADP-heptose:LPS heptosyltransferase
MRAGWSRYKEWPAERWAGVLAELAGEIPIVVIDPAAGHPLHEVIALVANARLHIGVDSFANHLTNFLWRDHSGLHRVPGVILWGSTQVAAAGYAHNTNISRGLACQPCFRENPEISQMAKEPCPYEHRCMQEIGVGEVVDAIRARWAHETGQNKYRVFGAALAA